MRGGTSCSSPRLEDWRTRATLSRPRGRGLGARRYSYIRPRRRTRVDKASQVCYTARTIAYRAGRTARERTAWRRWRSRWYWSAPRRASVVAEGARWRGHGNRQSISQAKGIALGQHSGETRLVLWSLVREVTCGHGLPMGGGIWVTLPTGSPPCRGGS